MLLLFDTISIVLPVFLVIGIGIVLKRFALLTDEFLHQANRLIYIIFLPLLLFYKIATADFTSFFNGPLVIASSVTIFIGFCLAYSYAKLRSFSPPVAGSFTQGAFRGNLAYVGLAICLNAYGDTGLTSAGVLMGFLVPLLNLFAILALILPQKATAQEKQPHWFGQLLLNPLIIACLLGISWSYWQIPLPLILERALQTSSSLALPLALITIGGSFSLQRIRGDLWLAGLSSTIKLIALPLIAWGLLQLFGVTGSELGIGVLMAGTPAATATYIMAHQLKGDAELAGSIVMLSTLFSALSYTLFLLLLKSAGYL